MSLFGLSVIDRTIKRESKKIRKEMRRSNNNHTDIGMNILVGLAVVLGIVALYYWCITIPTILLILLVNKYGE